MPGWCESVLEEADKIETAAAAISEVKAKEIEAAKKKRATEEKVSLM